MDRLKRLASHLPTPWQQELKRIHFRRAIHRQRFGSTEPEFRMLHQLIAAGNWVVDVGANVGHYTKECSDLVGPQGRVIAVEPVPDTFALLAANVSLFQYQNVTLLNLAASDRTTIVGMQIPAFETGIRNYYEARVTTESGCPQVMTVALDSLRIAHRIGLMKVDAEGHELLIFRGAEALLARDHPTLIVETTVPALVEMLSDFGYRGNRLAGSPNMLFR